MTDVRREESEKETEDEEKVGKKNGTVEGVAHGVEIDVAVPSCGWKWKYFNFYCTLPCLLALCVP